MQTFSYDSLGRLKTAKAEGGPAPYDHTSSSTDYDYDPIGNLTSLAGTTLGYQDGSHKHAATHRNGSPAYTYDANGNMVTRVEGSTTYTQAFDVENRLKTVTLSGSTLTTNFAYDASGQRLRTETGPSGSPVANDSRTITTYPFPGYEVEQRYRWMELCPSEDNCTWGWGNTATITRKTYFLGGQAIATRISGDPTNNGFFYLHSDHLGSSSLLTYGNGQASPGDKVNGTETRYYPYGSHRLTPTTQLTERDFTGQRENLELGLVYYNARFYVPGLGRFLTADTIVPQAGDPQAFNRYAYVRNNPIMLNDLSGHCWGFASGVRSIGFMNTLCTNTDSAFEIMTNPNASVGQRAVGATYLFVEGSAAVAGTVGVTMLGVSAAPTVGTYATVATSYVQTATTAAAAAYPTATAIAGGLAETAVECGMTGGGCTVADYAWGAATAGVASVSAKRMGCDRSFSEDTLVTTEEGLVPISEIEEGDYVLAYHEETGEVGYYPVTEIWAHEDPVLTYLVIEGEFIATTPNHPFYTTEGWVEAGELGEDAYVVRAGGAPGQVWESLTFTHPRQMYDLTVAEAHTFFVGEQQWLVHNCNGNSRASTRIQHGYEIYETQSGDVVKTGISGQPLNNNGTSPRANSQVNSWNAATGNTTYAARVVVTNIPNRQTALAWERGNALWLKLQGNSMSLHIRP